MRRTIRLCVAGALTASLAVALPAGATNHLETVLEGVDNGRGVLVDDGGNLWVASSGVGGNGPCIVGPEGGDSCYGETGAIHRLPAASVGGTPEDAADHVFLGGLPSHANGETQHEGIGPAGLSLGADGWLYYTVGLGADPSVRSEAFGTTAKGDQFATLRRVNPADNSTDAEVADLGDHEAANDPDGQGPDSNPFGVVAQTDDDSVVVADSGGNTILEVGLGGSVATGAVLPPILTELPSFTGAPNGQNVPAQAVPTQLGELANGDVLVGQLTGFPFAPGAAGVWTYDGSTVMPTHVGFTNIMDVEVGPDGHLYVLEIAHDGLLNAGDGPPMGALTRVVVDGGDVTRELLLDDVIMPGGMAFGGDHVYMTVGSAGPDGAVVRFDAVNADPLVSVTDDSASTTEDHRLIAGEGTEDQFTKVVADVTANDGDEVVDVTPLDVATGAVTEGSIVYQPKAHFAGEDNVPYRACNADGNCVNGVLHVMVESTDTDRIAGGTRIETAVEGSMAHYPDGAPQVLVARADLYPDALTGAPLAAAVGGPILLTAGDSLSPATAAELRRLGPTTVHVLGGPVAISDDVFDAIKEIVDDTQRIAGGTRFETAVKIKDVLAGVLGEEPVVAYVVEGADPDPNRGWPDAVSVSGLASNTRTPILLAETDRLPDETREAIDGMPQVTVVGGPVAISDAIRAEIEALVDSLGEIAGATRYETSQLIAQSMHDRYRGLANLALVSGGNWPDALVAGPLTGPILTGMLLVHPTDLAGSPEAVEFIEANGPFADLDLWGGPVAISEQVEAGVAAANQ